MEDRKIEELQEGFVIGEDIGESHSKLLVAKGTIVTREVIACLKQNRIEAISISDDKTFVQKFADIDARVDARFKEYAQHPVMQHIACLSKEYLKSKLLHTVQSGGGG